MLQIVGLLLTTPTDMDGAREDEVEGSTDLSPHAQEVEEHLYEYDDHFPELPQPISLSHIFNERSNDSDISDEESCEYDMGLLGSTPPHDGRFLKTSRRGHKHKSSKKSSGHSSQRYLEKQWNYSKSKTKSVESIPGPLGVGKDERYLRRHTVAAGEFLPSAYASFRVYEEEEKKRNLVRKHDREMKCLESNPKITFQPPELTPSYSFSEKSTPSYLFSEKFPLLTSSLTNRQISMFENEEDKEVIKGQPRFERSHSDAQLSLTLSSGQAIHCPSERKQFYRSFQRSLAVLSKRQQQVPSSGFHVPRQHSEDLSSENPYAHVNEQIWQELKAWYSSRTTEEQEEWDFYHHGDVGCVLNRIIHFRFVPSYEGMMNNHLFSGIDRDDYEPLSSLRNQAEEQEKNRTPLVSFNTDMFNDEDEQGPKTLTQQGSTDSEGSSGIEFTRDRFLSSEQISALSEISQLLADLEKVERLYQNSRRMGDENREYRQPVFKRRRDALILWMKVTTGLADCLTNLSQWFGVPVIPVLKTSESHTPSGPSRAGSHGDSTGSKRFNPGFFHMASAGSEFSIDPELSLSGLSRLSSLYQTQSSSASSHGTFHHLFSTHNQSSIGSERTSKGYSKFVHRTLKKNGLEWLTEYLKNYISPILEAAEKAMTDSVKDIEEDVNGDGESESQPLLHDSVPVLRMTSTAPKCWMDEFAAMNLPSFAELYLQLARVPLDIMQECMRRMCELNKDIKPSAYSIRKLIQECHSTLREAVEVRNFYRQKAHLLTANNPGSNDLIDADMEAYETDLKDILQLYFNYVHQLVDVIGTYRELLEEEWENAKKICTQISNGDIEAGLNFSHLACELIEKIEEDLKTQVDKCCDNLHERSLMDEDVDQRLAFIESCREFKTVVQEAREGTIKSLGFAKSLMRDLEVATEFSINVGSTELLQVLESSDHVQVIIPQHKSCMLFVPHEIADKPGDIQELLGVSFGRLPLNEENKTQSPSKEAIPGYSPPRHRPLSQVFYDNYLLIIKFPAGESLPHWNGRSIHLVPSAENIVSISQMQVEGIKMIVGDSQYLDKNQFSFISSVGGVVEMTNKRTSSHHSVAERINDLKHVICRLSHSLMDIVNRISANLSLEKGSERDDLLQHYRPTMNASYNLGFEYIKEVSRLLGEEFIYQKLGIEMITFAQHWMIFVITKCSRGHGKIPRWAVLGLDFLLLSCTPRVLATMSQPRFESLKKQMEKTLDHLVGETTPSLIKGGIEFPLGAISPVGGTSHKSTSWQRPGGRRRAASRVLSLQSHMVHTPLIESKNEGRIDIVDGPLGSPPFSSDSVSSGIDSPVLSGDLTTPSISITPIRRVPSNLTIERVDSTLAYYTSPIFGGTPTSGSGSDWEEIEGKKRLIIAEQCRQRDEEREMMLREKKIIGREIKGVGTAPLELGKLTNIKQTHFNWRRGRKLGEGQFGKVYECVNLDKGEINAVKVISLHEKSTNAVRDILSEIQVFLKINHPNIVHLHGVEIHLNELYIFMEYCNQGTLWYAAKQGLPERMIRIYTRDVLWAVDALHEKGIVHRDIKGANIFLSDNSVKLGDFGLSVQLKNLNKTAPQEIKHQRGTIPYMAPEVVLKQDMGRPMDIWGVACVVVEMITCKRPWIECEDNAFAIMYQLGQGHHPPYPKDKINSEMQEFFDITFNPDPKERANTTTLLSHPFVQVTDD